MPLSEAVAWALWRGDAPPDWLGSLGDGEVEANQILRIDEVRAALEAGRLKAFGQRGYGAPEPIEREFWSAYFAKPVTSVWHVRCEPYRTVLVERRAVEKLWRKVGAPKRGAPDRYDWALVRQLAETALEERPNVGVTPLADSLVSAYREARPDAKAPSMPRIFAKLKEWGLPPAISKTIPK